MRPTRVYQADKPNPRPILVETPLQPPMFSQSDVAAIRQSDRVSGMEHGRNRGRAFINYISGGQGGSGGGGGLRGGAGGIGEGPTLQYKAERIVVKNFTSPEATPSDFRRIPFGDIDLHSDIQVDVDTGAVSRRHEWKNVRRMYSARVVGHNEPMTVALYEGNHAEKEWKRDMSRYSRLRHPHTLQIYASASSSGIHAVIFHDELILFSYFLNLFRYSAILKACIMASMFADWNSACNYSAPILPEYYISQICWIRHSTGRLCVDFNISGQDDPYGTLLYLPEQMPSLKSILNLCDPPQESLVIASLGYHEWYSLCHFYLGFCGWRPIWVRAEVKLGLIICWPSGSRFKDALEIAFATDACITCYGWYGVEGVTGVCRGDSCATRYNSRDVFGRTLYLTKSIKTGPAPWLAQPNYILNQLKIVLNHEDYKYIKEVCFYLEIGRPAQNPPDGYLFLCSPKDFETGPMSYRWPHRPAYWSLNSSGDDPLSHEDASSLGFPPITLSTSVDGLSWDETVYTGLRKFDECKGFNPESQDIAKKLGYPLYEVSDALEWDLAVDREDRRNDLTSELTELHVALENYMLEMEPDSDSVGLIEELAGGGRRLGLLPH
ncbi:hypothetical protein MSAN_00312700 [Mycena sanguinolenta]|uniref:Uncharacterized protein n=1 Tax=Mycena sanguinolenta TaxID=230812 RepID=A0A8H6Z847_9AGAR|nr:hypothetical protein MSAN_00312700 [Mycena sanguinolenta]